MGHVRDKAAVQDVNYLSQIKVGKDDVERVRDVMLCTTHHGHACGGWLLV